MGWISKRMMRNRVKWGRPMDEEKRRAPLRKIDCVTRSRTSMFEADLVVLECGHEVEAYGAVHARCVECLRSK